MRVAIVGYGSVAAVHARGLRKHAECVAVFGPDAAKAEAFARTHGIAHAETDLPAALSEADVAIVCSPSPLHFTQAKQVLESGAHCLVELPACSSAGEAAEIDAVARARRRTVQCAHTSRYLQPYRLLREWIQSGRLGQIRHAIYVRLIPPRMRSWTDDALLHHAGHPLDLFLHWFGSVHPLGCAAHPGVPGAQDVALLGSASSDVPVTISISYTARLAQVQMTVIGSEHTVTTDGFSYVASDDAGLAWTGDEQQTYERAIEEQDAEFLRACAGEAAGVPWTDTMRLAASTDEFQKFWKRP